MKKILCYVAIVLLIAIIAIPPLTRVFYKEEVVVVKEKYFMLTCTKGTYVINQAYRNDKALSIKFKRPIVDSNLDVYNEQNALEFNLDKELKQLVNANVSLEDNEEKNMDYLLEYRNIVEEKLSGFTNYRLPLDSQLSSYQSYGYTCQKVEQ